MDLENVFKIEVRGLSEEELWGIRGFVKSRKIPRFWLKELDTEEYPSIKCGGCVKSKFREVLETEFKGSVWT